MQGGETLLRRQEERKSGRGAVDASQLFAGLCHDSVRRSLFRPHVQDVWNIGFSGDEATLTQRAEITTDINRERTRPEPTKVSRSWPVDGEEAPPPHD